MCRLHGTSYHVWTSSLSCAASTLPSFYYLGNLDLSVAKEAYNVFLLEHILWCIAGPIHPHLDYADITCDKPGNVNFESKWERVKTIHA